MRHLTISILLAFIALSGAANPVSGQQLADAQRGITMPTGMARGSVPAPRPVYTSCAMRRGQTAAAGGIVGGVLGYVLGGLAGGFAEKPGLGERLAIKATLIGAGAGAVVGFIVGSRSINCS